REDAEPPGAVEMGSLRKGVRYSQEELSEREDRETVAEPRQHQSEKGVGEPPVGEAAGERNRDSFERHKEAEHHHGEDSASPSERDDCKGERGSGTNRQPHHHSCYRNDETVGKSAHKAGIRK